MNNTYTERENDQFDLKGEKTWDDYNNSHNTRPTTVTIQLFADGKLVDSQTIHADSTDPNAPWKYEFTDLDKYDEDGNEIVYTINEIVFVDPGVVIPDQNAEYKPDYQDLDTIINKYRNEKAIIFSGQKHWEFDQNDVKRPSKVTIFL